MNPKRIRFIIGTSVVLLLMLIGVSVYSSRHKPDNSTSTNTTSASTSLPDPHPPSELLSVIDKYIKARENAVGADQPTPTSWIAGIKPITTPSWFAKLQPQSNNGAGNGLAEYNIAHKNGYIVNARLNKCIWNFKLEVPTDTAGSVYCELYDATIDQTNGSPIGAASLPFGWSHNGSQLPVTLKVVKQNGVWLIDEDSSGSDPD